MEIDGLWRFIPYEHADAAALRPALLRLQDGVIQCTNSPQTIAGRYLVKGTRLACQLHSLVWPDYSAPPVVEFFGVVDLAQIFLRGSIASSTSPVFTAALSRVDRRK